MSFFCELIKTWIFGHKRGWSPTFFEIISCVYTFTQNIRFIKLCSEVWTLELGTDIQTTFWDQKTPKWIRISNEKSKYIFFAITFILSPCRTRFYVRKWSLDQGLIEPRTNWTAAGDKSVRSIGQQTPDRLQTDVSAVTGRWPKSITLRRSRPRHRPTDTTDAHALPPAPRL